MKPLTTSLCDFGPPPPCPEPFNLAEYVLTGAGADKNKCALTIVGGSDAPIDEELLPLLSVVAPNETELSWISGVETREPDGTLSKRRVGRRGACMILPHPHPLTPCRVLCVMCRAFFCLWVRVSLF